MPLALRLTAAFVLLGALVLGIAAAQQDHVEEAPRLSPAANVPAGSFYRHAFDVPSWSVSKMTPTIISPARHENRRFCHAAIRVSQAGYEELIRPYMQALGPLDFGRQRSAGPLANLVSRNIAASWQHLDEQARGEPVSGQLVRVLVQHFPWEETPGRCVTLATTFYDVPDLYLDRARCEDQSWYETTADRTWVRLVKSYQLAQQTPRLVCAWIETTRDLRIADAAEIDYAGMLDRPELADANVVNAHWENLTGGTRLGLVWMDLSFGRGEVRPWSRAYRIHGGYSDSGPEVETGPLPDRWAAALREVVTRQ